MKMILLSSALIALLGFTGCSTKEPVVQESAPVATTPEPVVEEVVVVPEPRVIEVESGPTQADLEGEMKTVNFDFDKYDIRSDMREAVIDNSKLVNGDAADYMIKLEGNCDEWGSEEYNFALGLRRANAVKREMIAEGVDEDRISMISYGENNPVCEVKSKECWGQNRRVDLKLVP
ncbi:MAG: OmpA family protein [Thiovulaceae bacterium]|nr:OmpA family protein [Sulfurimonadaceae bacterium]